MNKKTRKNIILLSSIVLVVVIAVIVWLCCRDTSTYSIKGQLKGGEDKFLVLMEMEAEGVRPVDTINLSSKGKFSAKESIKDAGLFILQGENDYLMICPAKDEKIIVEGDFYDLSLSSSVTGSKESENLRLLIDRQKKTGLFLKAIQDEWDMADPNAKDSLINVNREKFRMIHKAEKDFLTKYIETHQGSLTTIPALYTTIEGNQVFSPKKDIEVYKKVLKGLEKTLPSNKHTKNLRDFIQKVELAEGKTNNSEQTTH